VLITCLGIFLVALALRLTYLRQYFLSPYWDLLFLDPESHQRMAERILSGAGLGSRAYFRSPAYFYLLATLEYLGGQRPWAPRIFQAILGSLTAALAGLFAFRLTDKRWVMIIAGLTVSCFWLSIYFDGELLITSSATFLNLLALYLLTFKAGHFNNSPPLMGGDKGEGDYVNKIPHPLPNPPPSRGREQVFKAGQGRGWLVLTSLVCGLAIVFRPNFLLFSAAVFIWWIARRQYRNALILLVFTALPILPVTVRNLAVAKDVVLVASQDGINFWIGNSPSADGRTVALPLFRRELDGEFLSRMQDDPWFREDVWLVSNYLAEKELGHPVKEGEVSSFWIEQTLRSIREDPGRTLKLFLKKCYFLIDKTTVSNDRDEDYHREQIPILRRLGWFHLGLIIPLALLGILLGLRERRSRYLVIFVFSYGFSIALFFVISRYRMKMFPELAIFAALALSRLGDYARGGKWKLLVAGVIMGGIFGWLSNGHLMKWNERPIKSSMRYNLGLAMLEQGRYAEAVPVLEDTIAIKPNYPEALMALANAYVLSGKPEESLSRYQRALFYAPDFAEAHYNFGLTLLGLKEPEAAYDHLLEAHTLKPELFPAPEQVLQNLMRKQ
jgi:hypothetical protein